jgi:hypothetical protein
LHFRFLQKATEAMFEMGQASVAAALACQKRFYDEITPEQLRPAEPVSPWTVWFEGCMPAAPPQSDVWQSWMAMANACSAYWTAGATLSAPPAAFANTAFPTAVQTFWGVTPWTFYQGPMVAAMLSYGVPYAVAAPTARASTSAMDAADAACAQWRLVFGSDEGQKSLARNARAQNHWPAYLH